ncbi:MAG TPA: proton-conducting transporter membrane subunit [Planktothrix sp.]|jgi:hydrogenase-4 component B
MMQSLMLTAVALPFVLALISLAPLNQRVSSLLLAIAGTVLSALAIRSWDVSFDWLAPEWVAIGSIRVGLHTDPLSAFFLLILGTVTICCALFSPSYLQHLETKINFRAYWTALFGFIGSMAGVVLAPDAAVFLVFWEIMSLFSGLLVASEYRSKANQKAAFIYIAATRTATIFLAVGFLLMYSHSHSWSFAAWRFDEQSTWIAAACILVGLVVKAGLWPFHIWLPYAHPAAPTPVSALMSGVMVKIAIYSLIRFFVLGRLTCQPIAYVLFAMACISAFWGVLFAVNQKEIKRLLAYSTVENIGLILISLALCIWARNAGVTAVSQLALLGVLLHSFSHSFYKVCLFLSAGSVDYAVDTRDFALLGGLNRRMPVTGATFMLSSAAICAIPPLNGFASKYCIYQALLYASFLMPSLLDRSAAIVGIGVMSCVGALAIASFAKATGIAFLGMPRSTRAQNAKEAPYDMLAAQIVLCAICIVTGISVPWLIKPLRPVLSLALGETEPIAIFHVLPLWQMALLLLSLVGVIYLLLLSRSPRHYITWDCGFGSHAKKQQVTAESFAQPIARIFTPVLKYNLSVDISGHDRRHFPEKIVVEPSMASLLETLIYVPAATGLDRFSKTLAKMQAGSIHLYLLYVCIALIVIVFAGTYIW